MKWTTKQPTKAGFYWYRDENRAVVLEVREALAKGHWFTWDWQQGRVSQYDIAPYTGEWYGPLKGTAMTPRATGETLPGNETRSSTAKGGVWPKGRLILYS